MVKITQKDAMTTVKPEKAKQNHGFETTKKKIPSSNSSTASSCLD